MAVKCRLCGKDFLAWQPKNLFVNQNREIIARIKVITGLYLREEKHLPRHICTRCYDQLQLSTGFRERCLRNQNRLAQMNQGLEPGYHSSNTKDSLKLQDSLLATESSPSEEVYELKDVVKDVKSLIVQDNFNSANESETEECPLVLPKRELSPVDTTMPINPSLPAKELESQSKTATVDNIPRAKAPRKDLELQCNMCGKYLKTVDNLKNHRLRHLGVKNFACEICNKRFVTKHLLTLHERVRHLGERPYPCGYCQLCFFTSSARNCHERLQHIRDKRYQCDECGKQFNTPTFLKRHLFAHTGQKPHSCETCSVSFSRTEYLKNHLRSKKHQKMAGGVVDFVKEP
ncbi:uncharacterized protein Dana_GF18167, isoform B [Drosophila ananassae]|uniref:Uncharacterized protein, isoform B n=1 Tax=Drosophila ananassae TaxID=7217 RepID=A0A0P8XZ92_DROAN|nr:transcription factor Ouib isoform X2 [Drosophila ananassae]KPU79903.1 uncharacterized protein Dana_GF18167, isoform B [Drosophila ananassae]